MGVLERDLGQILQGQTGLKRDLAPVQGQGLTRARELEFVGREKASGAVGPGAEVLEAEANIAGVLALEIEAQPVIVVVEKRVAVQREGGLLIDVPLDMEVLDAAKSASLQMLTLLGLPRVALNQEATS